MTSGAGFPDLGLRVFSGLVMAAVGFGSVYLGGIVFLLVLVVCAGLMFWELLRMVAPGDSQLLIIALSVAAAATVLRAGFGGNALSFFILFLVPAVGFIFLHEKKLLFAGYSAAILLAVASVYMFRASFGFSFTVWLILVVIAADVGGYFAGRRFGGPKIYPNLSPKKTWSGTIGGLVLAAIVGAFFGVGAGFVLLSVLTAAASQFGDVAESAVKRRTGVKDSSNLIPGHGGLLDRFDGLIGAALFVLIYFMIFRLPEFGGV